MLIATSMWESLKLLGGFLISRENVNKCCALLHVNGLTISQVTGRFQLVSVVASCIICNMSRSLAVRSVRNPQCLWAA